MRHSLQTVANSLVGVLALCLCMSCVGTSQGAAQDVDLVLKQADSAWARFPVGAWRTDEHVSFRPDEQTGTMTPVDTFSVTTTLVAVLEDHYVLSLQKTFMRGNSEFKPDPTTEERAFDDLQFDPTAQWTARNTTINYPSPDGMEIPAREFVSESESESRKLRFTSVYAELQDPRRDGTGQTYSQLIHRHTVQTLRPHGETTEIEWDLGDKSFAVVSPAGADWVMDASQCQTGTRGKVTWTQTTSPFVPGGLVHTLANEQSADGHFRQGMESRLIDFGLEPMPADQETDQAEGTADDGQLPDDVQDDDVQDMEPPLRQSGAWQRGTTSDVLVRAVRRNGRLSRRRLDRRNTLRAELIEFPVQPENGYEPQPHVSRPAPCCPNFSEDSSAADGVRQKRAPGFFARLFRPRRLPSN